MSMRVSGCTSIPVGGPALHLAQHDQRPFENRRSDNLLYSCVSRGSRGEEPRFGVDCVHRSTETLARMPIVAKSTHYSFGASSSDSPVDNASPAATLISTGRTAPLSKTSCTRTLPSSSADETPAARH